MAIPHQIAEARTATSRRSLLASHRDLLAIFAAALGLRLLFLVLIHDTYDYDEFVYLLLGRDYAHGAVPYHDFKLFQPPGIIVLLRGIEPLTAVWWPSARVLTCLVDSITALMVWKIGVLLWGRRAGLIAGLSYAISPLALVSASRVGEDPLITALGVLGLLILLSHRSRRAGVAAGVCLALAVWIKYPAAYFLPIYFLVAPRRSAFVLGGTLGALVILFLPFHADFHALYQQSVQFQRTRWLMPTDQRIETTLLFWLGVSPLALFGLLRRPPLWLAGAFLFGALFVLSSQVYYHYFVVVVPFGALLSAPVAARVVRLSPRLLFAGGVVIACGWAAALDLGGPSPLYVTAAHLSSIAPTVRFLDQTTTPRDPVLADRDEYAYLANRQALGDYFWNVGVLVNARYLENLLPNRGAVVLSYGASSGFPQGFIGYLNTHFKSHQTPANTIWLLSGVR